jgi:acyl-CoA thioester hydrolase
MKERTAGDRMEIVIPVTVEFEDVDSYRIAPHTKLVAYLERARVRYLAGLGLELAAENPVIVLYGLQMDFKKTVKLLDRLEVSVYAKAVKSYQLVLGYRITIGNDLVAKATTALAFLNAKTRQLIPVPPAVRERTGLEV